MKLRRLLASKRKSKSRPLQRTDLIKQRLEEIKTQISEATLLAVSKATDIQNIKLAYEHGQRDFGENRVADLEEKSAFFKDTDLRWHFIGRVQSNKITRLLKIPNLSMVHSLESEKKVKAFYKKEEFFKGTSLGIFLQINTSEEDEKQGLNCESYKEIASTVSFMTAQKESKFFIKGLMTMGKIRSDAFEVDARVCFKKLKSIKQQLGEDFNLPDLKLSMGMSQDYLIAIEEGADFVRIGTDLFKGNL